MKGDYTSFFDANMSILNATGVNVTPEQIASAWEVTQQFCGVDAVSIGRMIGVCA